MSEPLNIEQRCEVARAVTGLDFRVYGEDTKYPGIMNLGSPDEDYHVWCPSFKYGPIRCQRPQALAVVEWLADRIRNIGTPRRAKDHPYPGGEIEAIQMLADAIANKDVIALQRMVLELSK